MSDITMPVVADATLDLYDRLYPFQNVTDAYGNNDAALGYPLLRFLDGIGQIMQQTLNLFQDTPQGPGWSQIFDPTRCPTEALPWLAQWVGVRFNQTQNTDGAQRAAIQAEQGFNRGTVAALQNAAAQWLTPHQAVLIYERTPDPYSFTVVLALGQLTTGTYSQVSAQFPTYAAWTAASSTYETPAYPQAQVQAALEAQKPASLLMTITVVGGATYGQQTSDYTTYATYQAALATYGDSITSLT
jgi:P2-related tail formation protein